MSGIRDRYAQPIGIRGDGIRTSRILKNRVRAKAHEPRATMQSNIRALNNLVSIMEKMNETQESQNRTLSVLLHEALSRQDYALTGGEES